jgi:hypothetical protein
MYPEKNRVVHVLALHFDLLIDGAYSHSLTTANANAIG